MAANTTSRTRLVVHTSSRNENAPGAAGGVPNGRIRQHDTAMQPRSEYHQKLQRPVDESSFADDECQCDEEHAPRHFSQMRRSQLHEQHHSRDSHMLSSASSLPPAPAPPLSRLPSMRPQKSSSLSPQPLPIVSSTIASPRHSPSLLRTQGLELDTVGIAKIPGSRVRGALENNNTEDTYSDRRHTYRSRVPIVSSAQARSQLRRTVSSHASPPHQISPRLSTAQDVVVHNNVASSSLGIINNAFHAQTTASSSTSSSAASFAPSSPQQQQQQQQQRLRHYPHGRNVVAQQVEQVESPQSYHPQQDRYSTTTETVASKKNKTSSAEIMEQSSTIAPDSAVLISTAPNTRKYAANDRTSPLSLPTVLPVSSSSASRFATTTAGPSLQPQLPGLRQPPGYPSQSRLVSRDNAEAMAGAQRSNTRYSDYATTTTANADLSSSFAKRRQFRNPSAAHYHHADGGVSESDERSSVGEGESEISVARTADFLDSASDEEEEEENEEKKAGAIVVGVDGSDADANSEKKKQLRKEEYQTGTLRPPPTLVAAAATTTSSLPPSEGLMMMGAAASVVGNSVSSSFPRSRRKSVAHHHRKSHTLSSADDNDNVLTLALSESLTGFSTVEQKVSPSSSSILSPSTSPENHVVPLLSSQSRGMSSFPSLARSPIVGGIGHDTDNNTGAATKRPNPTLSSSGRHGQDSKEPIPTARGDLHSASSATTTLSLLSSTSLPLSSSRMLGAQSPLTAEVRDVVNNDNNDTTGATGSAAITTNGRDEKKKKKKMKTMTALRLTMVQQISCRVVVP